MLWKNISVLQSGSSQAMYLLEKTLAALQMRKTNMLVSVRRLFFSIDFSINTLNLQVLTMLVYLTVLNTIQMKLHSLPKELAALLHGQRQQSATNAAAKQHQSVWSMLV